MYDVIRLILLLITYKETLSWKFIVFVQSAPRTFARGTTKKARKSGINQENVDWNIG